MIQTLLFVFLLSCQQTEGDSSATESGQEQATAAEVEAADEGTAPDGAEASGAAPESESESAAAPQADPTAATTAENPSTKSQAENPPKPVSASPSAAPRCKIAVLDLKAGDGVSEKGAEAMSDVVTAAIADASPCSVLSRSEIRSMISFEAEKQLLGCADDSCLAELGGALGVDYLVMGSFSQIDASTLISLKMLNLSTISVEKRVTDTFASTGDDVVEFARWVATKLVVDANKVGPKPIAKVRPSNTASGPVFVEKKATLWRSLAWTSLALTGIAGVVTAASIGGIYGTAAYVTTEKTKAVSDPAVLEFGDDWGPVFADVANVAFYTTIGLAVPTLVLFFLPAEEYETHALENRNPASDGGAQ